ncbi:MAG: DUF2071 domain-containing protein [Bacteroidetes bacterium]|nr:MAG: DUF2071 domain-containing protein [Bacteroidota bacterium]
MTNFSEKLQTRIKNGIDASFFNADTMLDHFAIISYAVPLEKLRPLVHKDFELAEFEIDGKKQALISAVPFIDRDFHFPKMPFAKYKFGQTNYRAYVIDKNGEHCVWFFGTMLASLFYVIPRKLWKMPWHYGKFAGNFDFEGNIYKKYQIKVESEWAKTEIELTSTAQKMQITEGFKDLDQMKLILTHPIAGYYFKTNGKLGNYQIWHDELDLNVGKASNLYFQVFEDLKLLSKEQMQVPHSVLLCSECRFSVQLPPKNIENDL